MDNKEIYIQHSNWKTIIDYAASAYNQFKCEIGGMAIVHKVKDEDDDDVYIIEEPVILKQEISGGNTILDKEALAEYYVKTAMKHKDKRDLQFLWWHSHHTMAAFWSGTDLTAIDEFSDGKISMSLVVNLREEYKFRINVWDPIVAHEDIELNIINAPKFMPDEKVNKEVKALCSQIKSITHSTSYGRMHYSKKNQEQEELFGYNKSFGIIESTINDGKQDFMQEIAIKLDGCIEKICNGEYNYNQFKYQMKKIEKEIESSKHANLALCIPTKKQLIDNALVLSWSDLLVDVDDCIDSYADQWGY